MKDKELKMIIDKIEKHKNAIAKERNELRELYSDLGDLVDSFDCGVVELDEGIRSILDAIDHISEVV